MISNRVKINDKFWDKYQKLMTDVVLPYQYDAINDTLPDTEPSHAIKNFKIAAGLEKGSFHGFVFQDSDLAKWLEAVAYIIEVNPKSNWSMVADELIDIIKKAQLEDGYLNTYFSIKGIEKRWENLQDCHELYCAGHMIEAAVAYYLSTGKRKFLDIVCKLVDHIDEVFGDSENKLKGYPGHQEIELALIKLYKVTNDLKHLNLAKYFIHQRGKDPYYFDIEYEKRGRTDFYNKAIKLGKEYNQSHMQVREQESAVGHAVRAVYMYSAMADLAMETNDEKLLLVCKKIWNNILFKRMYITGAIGSMAHGEAFSFDYDLPNDTVYGETCASIGLIFFAHRMLKIDKQGVYGDIIEKILYNIVIAAISQDGQRFFYVNPLEVWPDSCEKNQIKHHVKFRRQKWFACACCPPNVLRLITSLSKYIYMVEDTTIYVNQYIGGKLEADIGGKDVEINMESSLPYKGKVRLKVVTERKSKFTIALRIPTWSKVTEVLVNGQPFEVQKNMKEGYIYIKTKWNSNESIEMNFDLSVHIVRSNPKLRENVGKVALQAGPIIYCLEEADNGADLYELLLKSNLKYKAEYKKDFLGGVNIIKAEAIKYSSDWSEGSLYHFDTNIKSIKSKKIKFIPYYSWANRQPGEMMVWIRELD